MASRVIPLARASGTAVEKRDSANLSATSNSNYGMNAILIS
jgi:hypothetical protein